MCDRFRQTYAFIKNVNNCIPYIPSKINFLLQKRDRILMYRTLINENILLAFVIYILLHISELETNAVRNNKSYLYIILVGFP